VRTGPKRNIRVTLSCSLINIQGDHWTRQKQENLAGLFTHSKTAAYFTHWDKDYPVQANALYQLFNTESQSVNWIIVWPDSLTLVCQSINLRLNSVVIRIWMSTHIEYDKKRMFSEKIIFPTHSLSNERQVP